MTLNQAKRIRRIYGIILSISIAAAGICLIAACVGIYRAGDHTFTREAVAQAFRPISLPVYLCLGLTVLSFPLDWWLPKEDAKLRAGKQDKAVLRRLREKTDLSGIDEALRAQILAEEAGRRGRSRIQALTLLLSAVVFGIYILTGDRFLLPDINSSMVKAMCVLLPCLAAIFGWALYAARRNAASVSKEIELMKQAHAQAPKEAEAAPAEKKDRKVLRGIILALAVAILIFGYFSGGYADVLTKAINICTECVGLG